MAGKEVESGSLADGQLLVERRGSVLQATFNRRHVGNALTWAMYDALVELCVGVGEDRSVRVMILAGAGKAFVTGTDITQFTSFDTDQDVRAYVTYGNRVMATVEAVPIPTIAAIHGPCIGGGAEIAAACDLRIASPSARYGFPIARTLGNALSTESIVRLLALVNGQLVRDLVFTARLLDADEMLRYNVVREVVSEQDLIPRAWEVADQIAANAPLTLRSAKDTLRQIAQRLDSVSNEDTLLRAYLSRDFKEGVEAFLAKRAPQWKGE